MSDRSRIRPSMRRKASAEPGHESWTKGPGNARARIAAGIVVPHGEPSFRLSPRARVFLIGPWFARQIEGALVASGVNLTSRDGAAALREVRENAARGHLNKYNPASLQQELDWAAEISRFPREALMPAGDVFCDPCLHERAAHGSSEALMTRRRDIAGYFARAFKADLTVVVLDHVETWFDRRTKLALNNAPLQRIYNVEPDRFALRRLDVFEVAAHLKAIAARIKAQNPRGKVVFALSPVPLERTYGRDDVMVASLTGKSALHTAAVECAAASDHVDYFPAYETALYSDPARVWQADRRTVRDELIAALTRAFVERYGLFLSAESATAGSA